MAPTDKSEHRHRRYKTRVFWILSATVVSLSGCLFQVTEISQRYFAYKVITQVDIAQPAFITGPKVIGCAYMRNMGLNHVNRTLDDLLQDKPYVNDTLEGWIPKNRDPGLQRCVIDKFIKSDSLCWSCSPSFDKIDVNTLESMGHDDIMMMLLGNIPSLSTLVRGLRWYVHPMNLSLYGHVETFLDQDVTFDGKLRRCPTCYLKMTYTHYETFSLEAPFRTDCREYYKHGCESRAQCKELCEQSMIPTDYLIPGHLGTVNMTVKAGDSWLNFRSFALKQTVTDSCAARFNKPDCHMEYYIPKLVEFAMLERNMVVMNLVPSPEPTITARTLEGLQLIDFVVYVLSVTSFWLGFCPLTCMLDDRVTNLVSGKSAKVKGSGFRRVDQSRILALEAEMAKHCQMLQCLCEKT